MSAPHRARSLLRVIACIAVSACSASPTAPHDSIAVLGYVERGATVTLSFLRGGTPVVPSSVTWGATPASVLTVAASGVAHFTDTGTVTITARDGGSSASLALHVAAPPTILFDMQDSGGLGNRDVYSMTLDGEAITRLSSETADNEQAASAGATVVFTSYRDGYAALYTVANTGGTETRLAGVPAPSAQAAVSADRSSIAFISPLNGADHLWTSAIDGSNATAAVGGPGFSTALQASPNWSPSRDTLVVVTTQFGNASLARLAIAEGGESSLTDGTTTDVDPAWSTDGKTIVFVSTRDGDVALFAYTVATSAIQRLSPNPANVAEPNWLADGRIVFTTATGGTTQLRWIDPTHPDTGTVIPTPTGGSPRRPGRE